jgi:hypothetical protein
MRKKNISMCTLFQTSTKSANMRNYQLISRKVKGIRLSAKRKFNEKCGREKLLKKEEEEEDNNDAKEKE